MAETTVAIRYAKSVMSMASQQQKADAVFADMQLIQQTCHSSRDLELLLESPIVTADRKANVLQTIFGSKVEAITMQFIKLLVSKGRENALASIAKQYISLHQTSKGKVAVKVTSATALSDATLKEIETMAATMVKGTVVLETAVNADLIGGVVLTIGDQQYDASVRKQLTTLKQSFVN